MNDPVSFLFRRKRKPPEQRNHSVAVVDIGSNSIRLVVFAGPRRNPAMIFNEKVMAGLGGELSETGAMGQAAMDRGLAALERFGLLLKDWNVGAVHCVATAAVRDASNGPEFAAKVAELGFEMRVLTGEEEAYASAAGVLSAIPNAHGVVGDLGGGSLELGYVENGEVVKGHSLPIGVLRSDAIIAQGNSALHEHISTMLKHTDWSELASDLPFYVVGGSWRGLARIDMFETGYPLTVFHNYSIAPERLSGLAKLTLKSSRDDLKSIPRLASSRIPTMSNAAALLNGIATILKPSEVIVSSYGLREGLIYQALPDAIKAVDPLIDATRRFGRYQSRYGNDGTALYEWVQGCFPDIDSNHKRLLLATCHLADIGWQANPDFRSERALEVVLHGNWVGIDAAGRAMIAQALYTNFGGGNAPFTANERLCSAAQLDEAIGWGLAIRAGQRLSAGRETILRRSALQNNQSVIDVALAEDDRSLLGESVKRRLTKLSSHLGINIAPHCQI